MARTDHNRSRRSGGLALFADFKLDLAKFGKVGILSHVAEAVVFGMSP